MGWVLYCLYMLEALGSCCRMRKETNELHSEGKGIVGLLKDRLDCLRYVASMSFGLSGNLGSS